MSAQAAQPAALLDRDGVINLDRGYAFRTEDFAFTPTAIEGIRLLNKRGFHVLVVSNQSGVARGYFTLEQMNAFNTFVQTQLNRAGAWIDCFYCCPYHPSGIIAPFAREHADRKPQPGMLLRALAEWSVDISRSFMVGDKATDMAAAAAAGIKGVRVPTNSCDLAAVVRNELDAR